LKTERFLIINPFGIGDVLFTTPLVKRIRSRFKDSFIGFICNSRVAPVLSANKNLDEIIVFDKGDYKELWHKSKRQAVAQFLHILKKIKSRHFDIVIDLSLNHQYAFFLALLGVPVRIGYNFKNRGRFMTHKTDISGYHDKHIVEYYLDLLDFLYVETPQWGVSTPHVDSNLEIFIPEQDLKWADSFLKDSGIQPQQRIAAVVPGGGASWGKSAIYKHWPPENFAHVADALMDKYAVKVILLGSSDDSGVCNAVSGSMRNKAVSACGKTGLLQFAALLKRCSLVICNDGGPLHMAAAVDVKTVSLFGPVDENVYGPYPPGSNHIVLKENIDCRPCYKGFRFKQCQDRFCLMNIRPEDVVKAAEKLLT